MLFPNTNIHSRLMCCFPVIFFPHFCLLKFLPLPHSAAATAAKSLQSCPTLCNPIDGRPPGSPVPGILQARTLEWVAISSPMHENEKWKWSRSVVFDPQRPHGLQPSRLLHPWDFPGKSTGVGCHCFLRFLSLSNFKSLPPWIISFTYPVYSVRAFSLLL